MSTEPEVEALIGRAVATANAIIQGEIHAYRGAKRLWSIQVELGFLEEALRIFAGLASEWEDVPDHRAEYERQIVAAADRFRSRFGP